MLIEDIVALAVLRTGRPVQLEFTREEQFAAATTRHPMRVHGEARRHARRHAHGDGAARPLQHRRLRQPRRRRAAPRLRRVDRRLSLPQQAGRGLRRLHQHGADRRLPRLRAEPDHVRRRIGDGRARPRPRPRPLRVAPAQRRSGPATPCSPPTTSRTATWSSAATACRSASTSWKRRCGGGTRALRRRRSRRGGSGRAWRWR